MRRIFFSALIVCAVLQSAAGQDAVQRPVTVIDSVHDYDLNPLTASYTYDAQVLNGLYEGLFVYDPVTFVPTGALCTDYKLSRDKKRWTFTLRDDARFSDGTPITADDVRASWLSLLSTPNAPYASLLDSVTGARAFREGRGSADGVRIDARSRNTLVVRLDEPAAHLPSILCHHAFSIVGPHEDMYSGAYKLDSYKDGTLVLSKNEWYYDADSVLIPEITFIQSDDGDENTYMLNTGAADWLLSDADFDSFSVLNLDTLHLGASFGTQFLFFKPQNEPWGDSGIRNALLEAVPYDVLRAAHYISASTLVYPLGGYPDVAGLDDYDLEDAMLLMDEARERLGIPKDEVLPLVFAINDTALMKSQAQILHDAWEPLGVELSVQVTPSDRYYNSIDGWNADLFSYTWVGDFADPLAFLELFRSGSSLNVAGYSNAEYDALISEALRSDSDGEHNRLMAKAEQLLLDDGMIIPVAHPVTLHAIDTEEIGGWTLNAFDIHPLKYLYIKKKMTTLPNVV